tara:strand:- start:132 stop:977 length:846 start_codon:yes stop_codon:yes gene_type:complete
MNYAQLSAAIQAYTNNTDTDFVAQIPVFVKQAEQRIDNTVQVANLRKNMTGNVQAGNKYIPCPLDFLSSYSLALYAKPAPTATGTAAAFTIVVSSATDIVVGMVVSGTGIATGAAVSVIAGTTITLSIANTGTVSGTVTFQGDYIYLLNRDVNFIRETYPNPSQRGKPKYYAIFGPSVSNVNELVFIVGPTPDTNYEVELHFYYYPESIVTAGTSWLGDNFDTVLLYGSLVEAYTYMKGEADMMGLYNGKYQEALGLLKNLGDAKQRGDAYQDGQVKLPVR